MTRQDIFGRLISITPIEQRNGDLIIIIVNGVERMEREYRTSESDIQIATESLNQIISVGIYNKSNWGCPLCPFC